VRPPWLHRRIESSEQKGSSSFSVSHFPKKKTYASSSLRQRTSCPRILPHSKQMESASAHFSRSSSVSTLSQQALYRYIRNKSSNNGESRHKQSIFGRPRKRRSHRRVGGCFCCSSTSIEAIQIEGSHVVSVLHSLLPTRLPAIFSYSPLIFFREVTITTRTATTATVFQKRNKKSGTKRPSSATSRPRRNKRNRGPCQ